MVVNPLNPNQKQTSKSFYKIAGGLIGFIFGLMLFIKFNYLWYELGKLEVFGFKAAIAMILMMILPFFLVTAPFWGIWLGVKIAGKLYGKTYGTGNSSREKGIAVIGVGVVAVVIISGYLALAKFSFHTWPFGKTIETSEPQILSEPAVPAPSSDASKPPAPTAIPQVNKTPSDSREKIAAYLKSAEKLLADFDAYQVKSQNALKSKSLSGIAESRKDLDVLIAQWKALSSPESLKIANRLMLEALDYEKQSIALIEEGLKNKDSSKIIQAIGLTDKVADNIFKAKEEMRRVMLNFSN